MKPSFSLFSILLLFPLLFTDMVQTMEEQREGLLIYENINSYQVLQRNKETNTVEVKKKDGSIVTLPVGGPYSIDDTHDIYVGDVWVLAGQSNMRGYGFFNQSITDLDMDYKIHLFQSNESWNQINANQPVHQIALSPRTIHHQLSDPTVRDPGLALIRGYSLVPTFNHLYEKELKVPLGVIPCAHGGVNMTQWLSSTNGGDPLLSLYGAMLDKIKLATSQVNHITGVLWYQGESDAVDIQLAKNYEATFKSWLIQLYQDLNQLNKNFNDPSSLFFIYAQIARTVSNGVNLNADLGWSLVRQGQVNVYQQLVSQYPRLTMISTINADMDDYIHLSASGSHFLGKRMSQVAIQSLSSTSSIIHPHPYVPIFGTNVTMLHYPYITNTTTYYNHILRVRFNTKKDQLQWYMNNNREQVSGGDIPINGFTIHDTQNNYTVEDMIYSIRFNNKNDDNNNGESSSYVDLYIAEKAYQLLVKNNNNQSNRYALYYGFGQHPYCNLMASFSDQIIMPVAAFGPLTIPVSPLN
ncbi:unnamed protein product [Cunninghamella blakesleeana]